MGRQSPRDAILEWIDDIPDSKLEGTFSKKMHNNTEMRLDMQGYTTDMPGKPRCFNLQVQINRGCKNKSLAKLAPYSVAFTLVPCDETWTPAKIKAELKKTVTGWKVDAPKPAKEGREPKGH